MSAETKTPRERLEAYRDAMIQLARISHFASDMLERERLDRAAGVAYRKLVEAIEQLETGLEALEAWKQLAATLGAEGAAAFHGDRPYLEIRMRIDAELLELGRLGVVDVTLADIRGRCEQAIVEKFGAGKQ